LFFRNIFIGQNFDRTSKSISDIALIMTFPSQTSRRNAYTHLFLVSKILCNPYQWITCLAFRPPRKAMAVYLWSLISFRRCPSPHPAIRISQRRILPKSSSNKCEFILGYHRPSSLTRTSGFSAHFGRVSGHCWTPRSLNTLLSTPKKMNK
jgi:hypothetical protein